MTAAQAGAPVPTERGAMVEWLARQIQAAILAGEIPVGSWLRQEDIAARYGVSRTPVREALRSLQASGVVEVLPRRGALVRGPTPKEIRDAYQVRATLEGLGAEMAARWIAEEDLAQLRKAEELFASATRRLLGGVADGRDAQWSAEWIAANDSFHGVVLDAAGNDRLRAVIATLHQSFPRNVTWIALAGRPRLAEDNVAQHALVRQALERGDADAARQAMVDHVLTSGDLMAAWFERRAGRDGP